MRKADIIRISPLGFPWKTEDPFVFCAYHRDKYPKGNDKMEPADLLEGRSVGVDFIKKNGWRMYYGKKIPGFPVHPHKGFETITIVKQGIVDHSDSLGSSGRYGAGDVQWMTAGKGIQHSEMFPLINKDQENHIELFQIWLNLPSSKKNIDPCFKMLWKENIPIIKEQDSTGKITEIQLVTGRFKDVVAPDATPDSWAANPENELMILTAEMEANAKWILPKSKPELNRIIYFYKGALLKIQGETVSSKSSIQVKSDVDIILNSYNKKCKMLILQGKSINEPVVHQGPFVLNNEDEIIQAYEDYQDTHFGGWPWPSEELVHEKNRTRFAVYADGKEDIKEY